MTSCPDTPRLPVAQTTARSPERPQAHLWAPSGSQSAMGAAIALSLAMITGGCSSNYVPSLIKPYRPDIQQGNVVIQSTLSQLKPGMSQEQVRFILGSPLLVDPFHPERWDYVFRYQKGTGEVETNRITIVFKDGLYTGHSGVPLPDNRR